MHTQLSSSKPRTYDIPKLNPEAGLTEWTNKIKAMQRQVDADEEAEQRRLEEEIAASRRARLRRSHGVDYDSRTNNLDMFKPEQQSQGDDETMTHNAMKVVVNRENKRTDNLQQSVGNNPISSPATSSTPELSASSRKSSSVSLAAFIGGRASGPKLSRHAPQQDEQDATQFQQHRRDLGTHPTLGKGIPLPNMVGHNASTKEFNRHIEIDKRNRTGSLHVSSEGIDVSSAAPAGAYIHGSKKHTTQFSETRGRTTSTPSFVSSSSWNTKVPVSDSQSYTTVPLGSVRDKDTFNRNISVTPSLSSMTADQLGLRQQSDSSYTPSQKPSVTPVTIAGHVSSQIKAPSNGPQILPSHVPSPAFLRPLPQKDPTPSISRLQGRGFVRSMVEVSTQLESPPPSSSDNTSGQGRATGSRRASVLDRWQPNISSPPTSPSARPMRRSLTATPKPEFARESQLPQMSTSAKSLKTVASVPHMQQAVSEFPPPQSQDGLGSATTLIVYKPKGTTPPPQPVGVDELGFQQKPIVKENERHVTGLPSPSGYPLSHPTKDRVRKPRKPRHLDPQVRYRAPVEASESTPPPVQPQSKPMIDKMITPVDLPQFTNAGKHETGVSINTNTQRSSEYRDMPSKKFTQQPNLTDNPRVSVGLRIDPPGRVFDAAIPTKAGSSLKVMDHDVQAERKIPSPVSPKHFRIPNTGNRATVMDVSQTMREQSSQQEPKSSTIVKTQKPSAINLPYSTLNIEKRKSNYERYSATALPPLEEEAPPTSAVVSPSPQIRMSGDAQTQNNLPGRHPTITSDMNVPLPNVDIDSILESRLPSATFNPKFYTISVDVMVVTGTVTTTLAQDQAIFYDTEVLAIIHRFKSHDSGLVSTTVWNWQGKQSKLNEKEHHKLQELAKRYGTTISTIYQYSEPPALVRILGGHLVIRQGTRTHWSRENTTMHLIRSKGGVIFVDEHDLNIRYLCSAFSYCISILDTVYVWYGRGSTLQERQAALEYARCLETSEAPAVEISEDGNDDDVLWMILGDEEFANADYWKWRKSSLVIDPCIWRVDTGNGQDAVVCVDFLSNEKTIASSVYIIDCVWELYVMIGQNARSHKRNIKLALHVASEMSIQIAPKRPYLPTIHVLILPSQLPCDLRMNIRDFDELLLNDGNTPDYMNILPLTDALDHLQRTSWDASFVPERAFIPHSNILMTSK